MASSKELELAVKIAGKLDASYGNALSGAAKQANAWSKTAQKAAQIATAAFAAVGTATAAATVVSVKNAIYDGINVKGRYRITKPASRCGKKPIGKNVTGWIDAKYVT